jgi:hypothetical protein
MAEPKNYMYVAFPDRLVMTDNLLLVTEPASTAVTAFTVQSKNASVAFVSILGEDEDGTQAARRWVGTYHESGAFMVSAWLAGQHLDTNDPASVRTFAPGAWSSVAIGSVAQVWSTDGIDQGDVVRVDVDAPVR